MPQKVPRPVGHDRAAAGVIGYGNNQQSLDTLAALRAQALQRLRRQRLVERVHPFGPRIAFEFIDEIIRHHPEIADDLDRRLEAYAVRLTPALLRFIGGDRFAASPTRAVGGEP